MNRDGGFTVRNGGEGRALREGEDVGHEERGGIVSSVCHGYCGLLNTRLSDGSLLVDGRKVAGFAWQEEVLARVDKLVPYNAEEEMKKRGALYEKALLPFVSYAVVDGNLVTGQNPGSAKETAEKVAALL